MAKKLSKEKAEVWDRLKNGIPPVEDEFDMSMSFRDILVKQMAKGIADEIDKEILDSLIKAYNACDN